MYEFCDPWGESHKERPLICLAKGGTRSVRPGQACRIEGDRPSVIHTEKSRVIRANRYDSSGSKAYPTPGTVRMNRGLLGSGSILARRRLTKPRTNSLSPRPP